MDVKKLRILFKSAAVITFILVVVLSIVVVVAAATSWVTGLSLLKSVVAVFVAVVFILCSMRLYEELIH